MRTDERFRRGPGLVIRVCGGTGLSVVEVGSYMGESAELFLATGRVDRIYCVDPWKGGYDDKNSAASRSDMSMVEKAFDERLGGDVRVVKCKGTLSTAVLPETADIVYIDGCHTYEACADDIKVAITRLNPGIVAGHDYGSPHFPGVKKAVDEAFGWPDVVLCDYSWIKFMRPLF